MNGVNRHIGARMKAATNATTKPVVPGRRVPSKKPLLALQQYETGYNEHQIDGGGAKPLRMKSLRQLLSPRRGGVRESFSHLNTKLRDSRTYVLDPKSARSIQWDIFMACLIAYSSITVPLYVGFPGFQVTSHWTSVDDTIDVCFGIDIVRNFLMGFYDEQDLLVVDVKQIAKNYARTWFLLDLVSTFPLEAAVKLFNPSVVANGHSLASVQLLRILRVTRILKLARLAKLRVFFKRVEETFGVNPGVVRLARLICVVLFLAHVLACMFHWIGQPHDPTIATSTLRALRIATAALPSTYNPNSTWLVESGTRARSDSIRYLYSLYWVIMTLTGVGYGDIFAVSVSERVFAIFAMMIGASVFGFVIGNISSLLESMDTRAAVYQLKMALVKDYIRTHKLPKDLRTKLSRYFEHYLARASLFDESSILSEIPLSLRNEIVHFTCRDIFLIPAFASINAQFVMDMAICIKPLFLLAKTVIAKERTVGREMYFLNSGIVAASNATVYGKMVLIEVLTENAYFGDPPLLFYTLRENTFTCLTNCEMYTLAKDDFDVLLEEYPDTETILVQHYHARKAKYNETLSTMLQRFKMYETFKDDVTKVHRLEDFWPNLRISLNGKLTTIEQFPIVVLKLITHYINPRGVSLFNSTFAKRVVLDGLKPKYATAYTSPGTLRAIIQPSDPRKLRWDIFLGVLIMYNVMNIPFQFTFQGGFVGDDTRSPSVIVFDYIVDVLFGIDMVLTFRTAYIDDDGQVEASPKYIATRYLAWWFWIDWISTFPFALIADAVTSTGPFQNLKLIRFVRLTRLLKLMRLLKLNRSVTTIENMLDLNPAVLSLVKLFIQVCFIAHWSSCAFYFVGQISETYYGDSWIGPLLWYASTPDKYITSLYFCFTTMVTVGYGDILLVTPIEVGYVIFYMLLGASVFGYIIGSMSSLVDQLQTRGVVAKEKTDRVKDYMKERKLPKALCTRIRRYYEFYLAQQDDGTELLSDLSDDLRTQLVLYLNRDVVSKIPFFARQDDACISYLMGILYQEYCTPCEYVFHEGEYGRHMYFLVKGTVEVLIHAGTPSEMLCKVLTEGSFFGELAMLLSCKRCASIRAKTFGILYVLSRSGMDHIHAHYPEISNMIMAEIKLKLHKIQEETVERMERKNVANHLPSRKTSLTTDTELLEAFAMIDGVATDLTRFYGGGETAKHRAVAAVINRLKKFDFEAHMEPSKEPPSPEPKAKDAFIRIGKKVIQLNAFVTQARKTRRESTTRVFSSIPTHVDEMSQLPGAKRLLEPSTDIAGPDAHHSGRSET
ncbi:hypothetical protein SDRG_11668 [Saprolegnia diclina VS20]|uniref:Cyclic nucleotide-binding domain-containing protein n=1 Tax=Saprolegnia diclina (strain VS20) TaxID=1156394 RepID=T0RE99_SAPDV|nr:hypothetical protein SDRG_11668 [Saprolegnia diclina VS20]EQC30613.1 hypothetical protein SDRG_11668 [Saprolegnia diclina VS20]|eukprot:XP_008615939.1 hypothetical protein SDRG_11668 [Saprolegnia diclina VS20]